MVKQYIYNNDVITLFLNDYKEQYLRAFQPKEKRDEFDTYDYSTLLDDIKDELYIIEPNPTSDFKLIVYEPLDKEIGYYRTFKKNKECVQSLRSQYKQFFKERNDISFKKGYKKLHYDELMKQIYHFVEDKLIDERHILLKNGKVYDNRTMEFTNTITSLPIKEVSTVTYEPLTEENRNTLGQLFNIMYLHDPASEDNITDWEKFLYYILCMFNKSYAPQTIFLVIDKSKVGKTAKINCTVKLGINITLKPEMLRPSELYNIAYYNSVIINESQGDKNIDGGTLNNLVDSSPLTTSVKNKNAITIEPEDKPTLNIVGESQPLIKSLSDGTTRRFVLVPKVNPKFIEYKEDPQNKEYVDKFYTLLYNHPTQVIEFYTEEIDRWNIKENYQNIRESMNITLPELEKLIEIKEDIYETYFNLNPEYENSLSAETVLIDSKDGLNTLLTYIEENMITINHISTSQGRKKYLNKLIKDNSNVKNMKDFGQTTKDKKNYLFAYSLTKKGVELVEKINKELPEAEQISTLSRYI